jgi:hypothetical protein
VVTQEVWRIVEMKSHPKIGATGEVQFVVEQKHAIDLKKPDHSATDLLQSPSPSFYLPLRVRP